MSVSFNSAGRGCGWKAEKCKGINVFSGSTGSRNFLTPLEYVPSAIATNTAPVCFSDLN
jgi:hypothetical protein